MTQKSTKVHRLESMLRDCYKIILHLVNEEEADTEVDRYGLTPNQLLGHIHYYFNKYQDRIDPDILWATKESEVASRAEDAQAVARACGIDIKEQERKV